MNLSPTYLAMRAYARGRVIGARLSRKRSDWAGVRVLGYHSISTKRDDLAVHPEAFREQMERALDSGMRAIRLDSALELLERPVEGRWLCVTFDDAYRDNLQEAAPVLEELGLPATIFVPTQIISGEAGYSWFKTPPPALAWPEIEELAQGGLIDFQAHTRTHPRLPHVSDDQAWAEIAGGKEELERHVPYPVTSFAYPAGLYGEREVGLVKAAGFVGAVTTDPGVNDHESDRFRLRRTLVYWQDRIGDFAVKLSGALDRPPLGRELLYRRLARG